MILITIPQESFDYESMSERGEWYVATDVPGDKSIEDLNIEKESGAIVLDCRKGFQLGDGSKGNVELLLWGTPGQLVAADRKSVV